MALPSDSTLTQNFWFNNKPNQTKVYWFDPKNKPKPKPKLESKINQI
jgi:hypothetical protein